MWIPINVMVMLLSNGHLFAVNVSSSQCLGGQWERIVNFILGNNHHTQGQDFRFYFYLQD